LSLVRDISRQELDARAQRDAFSGDSFKCRTIARRKDQSIPASGNATAVARPLLLDAPVMTITRWSSEVALI